MRTITMSLTLILSYLISCVVAAAGVEREVISGIATTRAIPGEPYELSGKRLVFTNWYYIQPGDLDWRDDSGKSVYVDGNSGLYEAHHIGVNPPHGIRIRAQKPAVMGPLDMPHRTVLRDGDGYKAWTSNEYWESADGMTWEMKAPLTFEGPNEDGVYNAFVDLSAPPEERYKAVWVGHITRAEFDAFRGKRPDGWEPRALLLLGEKDEVTCLRGSVSADGIHWTGLADPLVVEYADTFNIAYYDQSLRKYVIYTRYWSIGPRADDLPSDIRNSWTGVGRRAIGRSESEDFRAFPPSELIVEPTPDMLPSETLYTNCYTTIPGAPDQHLMFPAIWNASIDDTTRIGMMSSHNGVNWHWVPGGDILETGDFGAWNGGCIWAHPNLIELPNGDWALPYLGHNVPHKYPRGVREGGVGYAVWPKGRMVALEAEEEGEFTMIPIMAPGRVLKVNANTKRTGWVKVEVTGKDGRGFDACTPIVGDQAWTSVTWGDARETGVDVRTPITLRIRLYQAQLFGLEFE